jgi:hypothetical protein
VSQLSLAQRILTLEQSLAEIPHAFGGALALAYYADPRATVDIDINVFVPPTRFADVAGPLRHLGANVDDPEVEAIVKRDGQVRVMWDETPIDLFFSYDDFHHAAGAARRTVPFGDKTIPIMSAEHLLVCKAIFNRPKDWVDCQAMLSAGTEVDGAEVLRWVGRIAGDEHPSFNRMTALLTGR